MELVEIDPIGAEAAKAGFRGGHNVSAGGAAHSARFVHDHAELSREDNILPARSEALAQHGFRAALVAVNVGGIEQRDAEIERLRDDATRALQIGSAAEIVAAQADERNFKRRFAERAVLHGEFS